MKPEKRTYYFSVEGQTEKEYLKWLEDLINRYIEKDVKVFFDIMVSNNPIKRVRSLPKDVAVDVFHFCDYESNDEYHQANFRKIIDNLVKAKNSSSIKEYYLCYSNFTFDLWIILHKINYYSSISHRNNYIKPINHTFHTSFRGMQEFKRKENLRKIFNQLTLEDVKQAIIREREICRHQKLNDYKEIRYKGYSYFRENPSSNIGFCIEKILVENGLLK